VRAILRAEAQARLEALCRELKRLRPSDSLPDSSLLRSSHLPDCRSQRMPPWRLLTSSSSARTANFLPDNWIIKSNLV
jgi:hypothetical protein